MAGRPIKLTPEVQEKILNAIRLGNYIETAAAHAGISKDTLYRWLKLGARYNKPPYREFSDAVQKALADAEARDVAIIYEAAKEQWQASAWRLERKFPARWGRRDRMPVSEEEIDRAIETELARVAVTRKEADAGEVAVVSANGHAPD